MDKLQYMSDQYGEAHTNPYRSCQLALEKTALVPVDVPEALDYQKGREGKRAYVNGDRVEVTA